MTLIKSWRGTVANIIRGPADDPKVRIGIQAADLGPGAPADPGEIALEVDRAQLEADGIGIGDQVAASISISKIPA